MNRSYNRWNPTTVAIGAAALLLVVSVIGLATSTKTTGTEIERARGLRDGSEEKKDSPEQTSAAPLVAAVALGLGVLGFGLSLLTQYIQFKNRPQAPKEAWQKYG